MTVVFGVPLAEVDQVSEDTERDGKLIGRLNGISGRCPRFQATMTMTTTATMIAAPIRPTTRPMQRLPHDELSAPTDTRVVLACEVRNNS